MITPHGLAARTRLAHSKTGHVAVPLVVLPGLRRRTPDPETNARDAPGQGTAEQRQGDVPTQKYVFT